jgi:adenosylmethionine-8-amino-7-oxononanoate aminotransferase
LEKDTGVDSEYVTRLIEDDRRFVWHPFTQMRDWCEDEPLIITSGKGAVLEDIYGREYIDGVASIWTNVHGHRREEIDRAVRDQLSKVSHTTLLGLANVPSIELARKLVEITPAGLSRVFYSDNGSTAVEVAVKMAFQYWCQRPNPKPGKTAFVSFTNAYHGDTIGAVSLGRIEVFHEVFAPLLFQTYRAYYPYCYRCRYDKSCPSCNLHCLCSIEEILEKWHEKIAAIVIEPMVQGAGGMIVSPSDFLKRVRELATQYDVLLIADEVATGFGRTGKMFACEHAGVSPDLMALGKGLTGGYLPVAATVVSERVYNAFLGDYSEKKTFFHGHTYTGNPLGCAAAVASVELFERDNVLDAVERKATSLAEKLDAFRAMDHVGDVRQLGLMVGIELVRDKKTREPYNWDERIGIKTVNEARARGVILRPLGNVIVLMPPFCIAEGQLAALVEATRASIRAATG